MAGHPLHGGHMLGIHPLLRRCWESSKQCPTRTGRQHQDVDGGLLHGAVVSKGSRIEAHAVKANAPKLQIQNPLLNQIGIEAARKKPIALQTRLKRHPSGQLTGAMIPVHPNQRKR